MEPFLGEIIMFGGNFAPRGWAFCSGQIMPISQYQPLWSILGTTYGGDGESTFGLPDLRGRVPIHPGQGAGLPGYNLGQKAGATNVTLNTSQIPSHTHTVRANPLDGTSNIPTNNFPAKSGDGAYHTATDASMNSGMILNAGGSQSHTNLQPYTCVNFIIALVGIFPS